MTILLIIVAIIAAILIVASLQSNDFRFERSTTIHAAPGKILPLISDFHKWTQWSPWENIPNDELQRSYSGAPEGVGAIYEWTGKKSGSGRMEMLSTSPSLARLKLNFIKPFKAENTTDFIAEPAGAATKLTWAMYGPKPYMSKLMTLFVSMDKMIGKDFEKGLANLKAAAEA